MTKKFRIVIADSDRDRSLEMANLLAGQIDAEVVTARDGIEAVKLICEGECDSVMVGQSLLGMSGLEFVRDVVDAAPAVPVVMYGSGVGEKLSAEAIKAGASDFVSLDEREREQVGRVVLKSMRRAQRRLLVEAEEEQTRRRQKLFQAAFDVAPVTLVIMTTDGEILAANNRAKELIGGGSGAVIGLNVLDLLSNWDSDSYHTEARAGRYPIEFSAEFPEQSGDIIPVTVVVNDLEDAEEVLVAALVDMRRPTSYRRIWQYLMQDSSDMIAVIGEDGTILSASKGISDFSGFEGKDIVGAKVASLGHVSNRERLLEFVKIAKKKGLVSVDNFKYKMLDGRTKYASGSIRRLKGGNYLAIARDVTEKRKGELDIEVYGEMVAHEFRTPITAIYGYLDLIERQGGLPGESAENLAGILDGVQRLENTAEALREMTKAARREAPLTTVDSQSVAEEVIDDLSPLIAEKGGRVVIPEKLPKVNYLEQDLRLVLSNLVVNALSYSGGDGELLVELSFRKFEDRFVFYVKDFGKGIPSSIADKIFVPFFKTAESRGMGLGLAIVNKVVESHGGNLWLESWPGEGSTFFFSIPE